MAPVALLIGLLVALTATSAAPAQAVGDGQLSVRLVDAPEQALDRARARIYVVDHLAPGTGITRHLEVTNGTALAQTVTLYAGPSRVVDGLWSPQAAGATSELTSWTRLGRDAVRLEPGASATVPFSIDVPADAAAGERFGVVWAAIGSAAGQVRMIARVGIRVYLSVGPGGEPETDFTVGRLVVTQQPTGQFQASAPVTNTGARAVDLEGVLRLSAGPGQVSAGPFPALLGTTLAAGDRGRVVVELPGELPPGSWHASLEVTSGSTQRTVEAELMLGDRADAGQDAAALGVPGWAWGVGAVVLLSVLLGLLGLGWAGSGSRPAGRRRLGRG